jgi:hypothetical protein
MLVTISGASATVSVRRFSTQFQQFGTEAPSAPEVLRIAPDLAPQPWHLRIATGGRARICGLR